MKYNITITEQAENDLRDIYEYMAFTLLETEIALRQLERIEKGILSLVELPERFRVFDREPWKSRGLRQMPIDRYLVFYIPKIEDKTVNVIRVMYGGRNLEEKLYNSK